MFPLNTPPPSPFLHFFVYFSETEKEIFQEKPAYSGQICQNPCYGVNNFSFFCDEHVEFCFIHCPICKSNLEKRNIEMEDLEDLEQNNSTAHNSTLFLEQANQHQLLESNSSDSDYYNIEMEDLEENVSKKSFLQKAFDKYDKTININNIQDNAFKSFLNFDDKYASKNDFTYVEPKEIPKNVKKQFFIDQCLENSDDSA